MHGKTNVEVVHSKIVPCGVVDVLALLQKSSAHHAAVANGGLVDHDVIVTQEEGDDEVSVPVS